MSDKIRKLDKCDLDDAIERAHNGNEADLERLKRFAVEVAKQKAIGKVDRVGTRRLLFWLKNLSDTDKQMFSLMD